MVQKASGQLFLGIKKASGQPFLGVQKASGQLFFYSYIFLKVSYCQVVQLPPVPGNLVERTYIASLTPGVEYAIFIQV